MASKTIVLTVREHKRLEAELQAAKAALTEKKKKDALTWRTADGRELLLSEMSYTHIINCIALIDKKVQSYLQVLHHVAIAGNDIWQQELRAALPELSAKGATYFFPIYEHLVTARDEQLSSTEDSEFKLFGERHEFWK